MKKNKILLFSIFVLTALTLAGCAAKGNNDQTSNTNNNPADVGNATSTQARLNSNFTPASSTDLIVGTNVMAIGTETGGVMTANRIIIGNPDTNFEQLGFFRRSTSTPTTKVDQLNNTNQARGNVQNLTPEQRAQFEARRQQYQANGGQVDGNQTGGRFRSGGSAPVIGQILSVDTSSITLKLNDGGSKIIYYSAATEILKAKNQ